MIFNWRLWIAFVMTIIILSAAGYSLSRFFISPPAEYFRASYFEFAPPQGWHCDREGSETICEPPGIPPHDAIIIFAAKIRNEKDARNEYYNYLGKSKTWSYPGEDKTTTSEVVYFKKIQIGDYEWVDALHRNSEVVNFNTRYLATVTSHLGLVVSFTARQSRFEYFTEEFEASINTLRIYQSPSAFN